MMPRTARSTIALVLGILMTALGAIIALRPLWGAPPLSGSRLMDAAFAVFFLIRGVMNLRTSRRPAVPPAPGPGSR